MRLTPSLVTIIFARPNLLTIHGQHVSMASASRTTCTHASTYHPLSPVLDPRIMYEGLKSDYASDPSLLADLDKSMSKLKTFYQQTYARRSQPEKLRPSQSSSSVSSRNSHLGGSPEKVNFTLRYQMKDRIMVDEFDEYFKLPREDFENCKPLQWWLGRRSQFLNLNQLVCDIFSIPGRTQIVLGCFQLKLTLPRRLCSCG